MHRRGRLIVALWTIGLVVLAVWPGASRAQTSIEEQFKYGSIGAEEQEGLPYWIWQVLPRMFADKLPPGGYGALGMIWEPDHDLPIGLTRRSVWGVERVAVNCAFCHTASVRVAPDAPRTILLGGPSHQFDPQAYSRFLDAAALDPRFNASDMMAAIGQMTTLSWWEAGMYRFVLIPAVKRALVEHGKTFAWMNNRPVWGKGRIDPQNPFKFTTLKQAVDNTIGNSDMPPLWNMKARRGMALHWDGMNTDFREVVLSSGLGNGATVTSLPVDDLTRLGDWLDSTPPPKYPLPIAQAMADEGEALFIAECARCHAPGGIRTGQVIPIDEVGTDRHRLDTWTEASATAFNDLTRGRPWAFKNFRKTNGMVAGLLDGIWARGPYLHNGSVPTLADLLEPAPLRPTIFFRGYDVIDAERGGFISTGPAAEAAGFRYDVTQPGNGHQGHEFGTSLTSTQKRALVEYLKRL